MRPLLIFLLSLSFHPFVAQNPTIQWQKSLGGSNEDTAKSIVQSTDGGYVAVGISKSSQGNLTVNYGENDFWIVKTDGLGNIQWQKSYGGSGEDQAASIQNTSDGGYIVAGFTKSTNGNITNNKGQSDYWVIKLDSNGNIQWQKTYGGPGDDQANSIKQTSDGGYIIAGISNSTSGDITNAHAGIDYWVVKTDSMGNIQWQKSLGGTGDDRAYDIQLATDGGYVLAGSSTSSNGDISTNSHGGADFWVVKLSNTGNIQWEKNFGGTGTDVAYSIKQTSDGGYVVAGDTLSQNGNVSHNNGGNDYWILKLDALGNLQWENALGGSAYDRAYSVIQLTDGNYLAAGYTPSQDGDVTGNHGAVDFWVVKLNQGGNLVWQKCLGGSGQELAYSIIHTSDGGAMIAGSSQTTPNSGDVTGNHGNNDFWIVKLGSFLDIKESSSLSTKPTIYPNPAKDFINISNLSLETTIIITDISGKKVFTKKCDDKKISINTSDFVNGGYFIQIEYQGTILHSEKIIISK